MRPSPARTQLCAEPGEDKVNISPVSPLRVEKNVRVPLCKLVEALGQLNVLNDRTLLLQELRSAIPSSDESRTSLVVPSPDRSLEETELGSLERKRSRFGLDVVFESEDTGEQFEILGGTSVETQCVAGEGVDLETFSTDGVPGGLECEDVVVSSGTDGRSSGLSCEREKTSQRGLAQSSTVRRR